MNPETQFHLPLVYDSATQHKITIAQLYKRGARIFFSSLPKGLLVPSTGTDRVISLTKTVAP